MTPAEYEARCAEMLRTNAHNMSAEEIERFAYGSGDSALQLLGVRCFEFEVGCHRYSTDDDLEFLIEDATRFMR